MSRKLRPYAVLIAVAAIILSKFGGRLKEEYFSSADSKPSATSLTKHKGRFEVLENCQWIKNRSNDGDSFLVKHGNNEYTFRLYFADAPEKYLSDQYENQRKRVAKQGEYFGGLNTKQTVEIGLQAKAFVEEKLKGKSFTVLTNWEAVYGGDRYYAFVWLPGSTDEKPIRLCEQLVKAGLARIHTKGPSGKKDYGSGMEQPSEAFAKKGQKREGAGMQRRLRTLEAQAKKNKVGAWGVK